jgi:hypothetical protein
MANDDIAMQKKVERLEGENAEKQAGIDRLTTRLADIKQKYEAWQAIEVIDDDASNDLYIKRRDELFAAIDASPPAFTPNAHDDDGNPVQLGITNTMAEKPAPKPPHRSTFPVARDIDGTVISAPSCLGLYSKDCPNPEKCKCLDECKEKEKETPAPRFPAGCTSPICLCKKCVKNGTCENACNECNAAGVDSYITTICDEKPAPNAPITDDVGPISKYAPIGPIDPNSPMIVGKAGDSIAMDYQDKYLAEHESRVQLERELADWEQMACCFNYEKLVQNEKELAETREKWELDRKIGSQLIQQKNAEMAFSMKRHAEELAETRGKLADTEGELRAEQTKHDDEHKLCEKFNHERTSLGIRVGTLETHLAARDKELAAARVEASEYMIKLQRVRGFLAIYPRAEPHHAGDNLDTCVQIIDDVLKRFGAGEHKEEK